MAYRGRSLDHYYENGFIERKFGNAINALKVNEYEAAQGYFDKVIKLDPEFQDAYFNRAYVRWVLKDNEGMCEDLAKAGELGDFEALFLLDRKCKE